MKKMKRIVASCLVAAALGPGRVAAQTLAAGSVFTAIAPCRIVDTRLPSPVRLAAGVPRAFHVVGTVNDFAGQGGSAGGCGIPGYDGSSPRVTGVMFNFVAVNPLGAGNLRAWPSNQQVPNAAVVNYAAVPGLNIANGIAVAVSQDAVEGDDLTLRADVSDTHLVVDVVGYFARPFEVGHRRYVVEAGPGQVGRVVPFDVALMDGLCRDADGCQVTIQLVNWDAAAQPGNVASRSERLFVSQTKRLWRLANIDLSGRDDSGSLNEWIVYDCFFTDGETFTDADNGRSDDGPGFALLNLGGGSYSDLTVTCRAVIED
jgi:hypothetical protein